jgi:hypothetical protein
MFEVTTFMVLVGAAKEHFDATEGVVATMPDVYGLKLDQGNYYKNMPTLLLTECHKDVKFYSSVGTYFNVMLTYDLLQIINLDWVKDSADYTGWSHHHTGVMRLEPKVKGIAIPDDWRQCAYCPEDVNGLIINTLDMLLRAYKNSLQVADMHEGACIVIITAPAF